MKTRIAWATAIIWLFGAATLNASELSEFFYPEGARVVSKTCGDDNFDNWFVMVDDDGDIKGYICAVWCDKDEEGFISRHTLLHRNGRAEKYFIGPKIEKGESVVGRPAKRWGTYAQSGRKAPGPQPELISAQVSLICATPPAPAPK